MNAKLSSIAIALIATTASAFAADPVAVRAEARSEFVEHAGTTVGKSRADVRAELEQAYAQGQVGRASEFVEHTHVATGKSREEVRGETVRAAKSGRSNAYSGS